MSRFESRSPVARSAQPGLSAEQRLAALNRGAFLTAIAIATSAAIVGARPAHAAGSALATAPVQSSATAAAGSWDGVVEAVRQTVIAAQIPGAIVSLQVRVGDAVRAGQVLMKLDARAADQAVAAGDAMAQAAKASHEVASKDLARQKQLLEQNFISQAAYDAAEANFAATEAQVTAQIAQAGAAKTQTDYTVIRAPYAGVVSEVPVVLGDMAMPGRALVTVYDPAHLRVTAAIPQSVAIASGQPPRIELPDLAADQRFVAPAKVQLLPTLDAATHTRELRLDLPAGFGDAVPGQFARVWLGAPVAAGAASVQPARLTIPQSAVVRRAEMVGAYVVDAQGRPLLRQIRLGRGDGDRVEVLAGVSAGERVATDPQAAARIR